MNETYQMIRGIPFPNFKKENIVGTLDYYPEDGDIVIASYPKTGTTWLQYIVVQITSKGELFPSFNDLLEKVAPMMEMAGPEVIDKLTGVRIYKHHYKYDMVKKNPKTKTIYIYRNPADTLISFYHMHLDALELEISLDEFFEAFLSGNLQYGSYFQHISSYMAHKDNDNLLMVSYEKLQANAREGILRIAKFLGEDYYQCLLEDQSVLSKILERTSFNYMKKNLSLKVPQKDFSCKPKSVLNFFRKGVVGDGKHVLFSDQQKKLQVAAEEIMKGCEVLEEWFNE